MGEALEHCTSREEAWERHCQFEESPMSTNASSSPPVNKAAIARSKSDCSVVTAKRSFARVRSLTDADFEELQGCIDLGFELGVHLQQEHEHDERLFDTLPALEVCRAVSRQLSWCSSSSSLLSSSSSSSSPPPSSPSDDICRCVPIPGEQSPLEQMKNMRHWAKAVAFISRQQLAKTFFNSGK